MSKIYKRLIISDFDKTLTCDDNTVPESVKNAILRYVAAGGIFAVCTGRMLRSVLPRVREIGLKGLVVAYQGTVIADIESGEMLKFGGFSTDEAREVCLALEEQNSTFNIYAGDRLFTNIPKDNKYLKTYEKITGVDAEYSEIPLSDLVVNLGLYCQKAACLVFPDEREALFSALTKKLGKKYDVTCSADVLVEVSPKSDNKGEALKFLARKYNIPISETVAIGDNLNDLSMIKAASVGVAVGNAAPELKAAADFVSVTNNEGAVAQTIEKFGFV